VGAEVAVDVHPPEAPPVLAWNRPRPAQESIDRRLDRLERMLESLLERDGPPRPKDLDVKKSLEFKWVPPGDAAAMHQDIAELPKEWNLNPPNIPSEDELKHMVEQAHRQAAMATREAERAVREMERAASNAERMAKSKDRPGKTPRGRNLPLDAQRKDLQSQQRALQQQLKELERQLEHLEEQRQELEKQGSALEEELSEIEVTETSELDSEKSYEERVLELK
jgi:hypothetical protein